MSIFAAPAMPMGLPPSVTRTPVTIVALTVLTLQCQLENLQQGVWMTGVIVDYINPNIMYAHFCHTYACRDRGN